MILFYALLALTGLERIGEILLSNANAKWSLARGGIESGRGHFPAMVALHACFLAACALEPWLAGRQTLPAIAPAAFVVAMGCQALRWWCITTLGRQWNTRVIVVPGLARVTGGPYRWLDHPNYLAVVVEGIALPLVGGAWATAVLFTILNAFLLNARLRSENAALSALNRDADAPLPPAGFAASARAGMKTP